MRVLVVAAHADDETLGAGGTIARLAAEGHRVTVAVLTGPGEHGPHPLWPRAVWDTIRGEARRAWERLGVAEILFRDLPAALLAEVPSHEINRAALEILEQTAPERLFVPFVYDIHRDHREVFHAFSVAWRPVSPAGRGVREVLAYETVSSTHWNAAGVEPGFCPNTWIDVSDHLDAKLEALAEFDSQMHASPHPRSIAAVRAQALWRGAQIGVAAAEAFVLVRKLD